jgi:hypothetical protein
MASRSTIGLSSQQKDLVIMHLKSEVYELKQQQRDFQTLNQQIQSLSHRVSHLVSEKTTAEQDYEGQLNT